MSPELTLAAPPDTAEALRRELAKFPPQIAEWMTANARYRGAPVTPGMIDAGKNIRALANGLGLDPADLPADAVALYVAAGNPLSNGTIGVYGKRLASWRRWLAEGDAAAYVKPDAGRHVADKDIHADIVAWARDLCDEGTLNKRSARKYKLTLHRLCQSAGGIPPAALTRAHVSAFLGEKRRAAASAGKPDISPSTQNHVKSVCASYAAWAEIPDPAAKVKRMSQDPAWAETEQPIATAAEVASLLLMCEMDIASDNAEYQHEGRVLRALIKACAYNALRIEEACHLEPGHRWTNPKGKRRLNIPTSKTMQGRPRSVPLYPSLDRELDGWGLPVCPPSWTAEPADGRAPAFYARLDAWGVRHGVKVMWHGLRRFAASELYDRTKNLVLVQRLLGHATPSMTLRYIGLSDDELYTDLADTIDASLTDLAVPVASVIDLGAARAARRLA